MKDIKKYIGRIIVVMLCITMISSIIGCSGNVHLTTGFSDDELMKVSGTIIPMSIAKLLLAEERNAYISQYGEDIWKISIGDNSLADEVKNNIKIKVSELVTIAMMAEDMDVSLSKSERTNIEKAATVYVSGLSDEEKDSLGVTVEDVNKIYEYYLLTMKLYEQISKTVDIEISDEDARVIKVQYCYVKKDAVGTDEETTIYTSTLDKINAAYKELQEGKSFGIVAKEYSDDTTFECEIGRGVFGEAFDEVAFELENGMMSEIIETEEGYYIIKCLNSYNVEKTKENKVAILERYKEEAFKEVYMPFIDKQSYEYNEKDYNNIDITALVLDNNSLYGIFETYISN